MLGDTWAVLKYKTKCNLLHLVIQGLAFWVKALRQQENQTLWQTELSLKTLWSDLAVFRILAVQYTNPFLFQINFNYLPCTDNVFTEETFKIPNNWADLKYQPNQINISPQKCLLD